MPGSPDRTSFTPGRVNASPSDTQGGSRVPELGPLGSVRGALSNGRPYRDLIDEIRFRRGSGSATRRQHALTSGATSFTHNTPAESPYLCVGPKLSNRGPRSTSAGWL